MDCAWVDCPPHPVRTIQTLKETTDTCHLVDWSEINAGWGFAAQALVSIAEFINYEFKGYVPLGQNVSILTPLNQVQNLAVRKSN